MTMRRRDFLKTGVVAAAGAGLAPESLRAQAQSAPTPVASFELDELTIADLHSERKIGPSSARGLVERYLARIQEIDKAGRRSTR